MGNVRLSTLLFEGLWGLDARREPEKRLAKDFRVSSDKKQVSVTIHNGVRWSDGGELTAGDVIATFSAMRRSDNSNLQRWISEIDTVRSTGLYTVDFLFKAPHPTDVLLRRLTFKILPSYKLRDTKLTNMSDIAREPVGCGFYSYDARGRDANTLFLRANEDARKRKRGAQIDVVKLMEVANPSFQVENLQNKRVELLIDVPPTEVDKLEAAGMQIVSYESLSFQFIGINQRNPILQDPNIRRAMTLGFNRALALNRIYLDRGVLISGPFPPSSPYADPSLAPFHFDVAEAIRILELSGCRSFDQRGIRLDPNGRRLSFVLASFRFFNSTEYSTRVINMFIDGMKKLGIEIIQNDNTFDEWEKRVKYEHAFDLAFAELVFDEASDIYPLFYSANSGPGRENFIGYHNPEVDRLLVEARRSSSAEERKNINRRLHRILHDDCPYIYLWSLTKVAAAVPQLRGFATHVTPYSFFDFVDKWSIAAY